ncbi:carbohydrate porin [Pinirhizobacter soli]|uniref:carbohydrate porin n=1 Tax=Pinirhizobacter soli TaxID=2786953 RepID=UPI00202A187B|nr:carbohydrate porin [Pinirhizobacter soli]
MQQSNSSKPRRWPAMRALARAWPMLLAFAAPGAYAQDTSAQAKLDQDPPTPTPTMDWLHQPGMTGDWGGARTQLTREGVDIFSSYQVQTADIVHGGVKRGTETNNQILLGANFDMHKLVGIDNGIFTFAVSDRYGANASTLAGVRVTIDSNYGEGENFRLANMSFRQNFYQGRLSYQLGWFPAAAEFDYTAILCSFLNQGFCGHPNSLAADTSGFQNPPGAQLGARVTGFITKDVYLKVGVFDVNPTRFTDEKQGFRLSREGRTGEIYLSELGWNASLGERGLVGHYKIGAYYDTSEAPDVVNPKIMHTGRDSGWLAVDQMVYGIGPDARRGLVLFLNLTQANASSSIIESYNSAGFVFQGPFASRPDDVLSLGWAKSNLNHRKLEAQIERRPSFGYIGAERYIDLSYKIQLTPWMFITPDVQYLIHPGVFSAAKYPNATVIGGAIAFKF